MKQNNLKTKCRNNNLTNISYSVSRVFCFPLPIWSKCCKSWLACDGSAKAVSYLMHIKCELNIIWLQSDIDGNSNFIKGKKKLQSGQVWLLWRCPSFFRRKYIGFGNSTYHKHLWSSTIYLTKKENGVDSEWANELERLPFCSNLLLIPFPLPCADGQHCIVHCIKYSTNYHLIS